MAEIPVAPGITALPQGTQDKLALLWREAEEKRAPCVGNPEKYVDYPEENPPDRWEANKMCFGCPVRALCKQVAREVGATYGVWGGEVYNE